MTPVEKLYCPVCTFKLESCKCIKEVESEIIDTSEKPKTKYKPPTGGRKSKRANRPSGIDAVIMLQKQISLGIDNEEKKGSDDEWEGEWDEYGGEGVSDDEDVDTGPGYELLTLDQIRGTMMNTLADL
jgi:hypothetical protein